MRNNIHRFSFIHVAGFVLLLAAPATAAEFAGLGDLSGGTFHSQAQGVSDDGNVVVGGSFVGGGFSSSMPFRWTQETGMVSLPKLSGAGYSAAYAVSADGSVVAGKSHSAFRWTENQGTVNLGSLGNANTMGAAHGVSADGSVVAAWALTSTWNSEPFRHTEQGGKQRLGTLFEGRDSYASGMSADGSTVVGYNGSDNLTDWGSIKEATRWTETGGLESLGDLPGDTPSSLADDASADGSVIVGVANARADFVFGQAFRWTEPTGMVSLGEHSRWPAAELGPRRLGRWLPGGGTRLQ